jgi:pentatricopeptide repeat domain-containing protein 1
MELVAEMRSRAISLNVHTYSALLNVCLKANELDLALDVYARMLAEGVTPNLVTFNTLLDIYNKTGRWVDALNVLDLLQHQHIRPEARTYNAIISTCNGAGRYVEVSQRVIPGKHDRQDGLGSPLTNRQGTSLQRSPLVAAAKLCAADSAILPTELICRCAVCLQAVRVYEVMTAAGVEPNGASYNAALTSYARSGQLDAALTLFAAMGARGYERGTNTYAAVLAACERPGR